MNSDSVLILSVVMALGVLSLGDILGQFSLRKLFGRRIMVFEVTLLAIFFVLSLYTLWWGELRFGTFPWDDAVPYRIAAFSFYFSGAVGYFQCKSFFSRGYTIRILVDLLERGKPDTVQHMKDNYGGVGIGGMIVKRFKSMESLRLLKMSGDQVGPTTPLGYLIAVAAKKYRDLLGFPEVG